jgi:putative Mg2+ transporter-C (MgtC) family protein
VLGDVGFQLELVALLVVASVLGAAIGAQREIHGAAAGLRTHLLVCFGSALFTILSAYGFLGLLAPSQGQVSVYDPTRIAAQVVAGIGFLGAGAILKEGASIRGLTTAASLWATAAIGMAVGADKIILAVAGTVVMLIALGPLGGVSARLAHRTARQLRARLRVRSLEVVDIVVGRLSHHGIQVDGVATTPLADGGFDVEIKLLVPAGINVAEVMSVFFSSKGVESVETETMDVEG